VADLRWNLPYKGEQYEFDADRDLTVRNLSFIKKLYGPDIGRYQLFILALGQGDPDAWACAMYLALKNANYKPLPKTPEFVDFSVGVVMEQAAEDVEKDDSAAEDAAETIAVEGPTVGADASLSTLA
jgi:hypothetical protein